MKKSIFSYFLALVLSFGIAMPASAAEANGLVGFVNMQVILQNYPGIKETAKQIADKQAILQKSFDQKAESLGTEEKKHLQAKLNQELAEYENVKMASIKKNIAQAVAAVAENSGIKSVVHNNAMVFGGEDLTDEVVKKLSE